MHSPQVGPSIMILEWDSNFFGRKVGRIEGEIYNEKDWLTATENLMGQSIDLAYYSSIFPLKEALLPTKRYSIRLVDRKTTYLKKVDCGVTFDEKVSAYNQSFPEPKLLELSVSSGVYSRFKVDEKIGVEKFEDLYRTWIINSVNKKLAKEVLVYKTGEIIAGFVTLGEKNEKADVGIIAVDPDFRGRGIAKALMRSAESWFATQTDLRDMQVVTQGDNQPACKLYESSGFAIEKVEYFYHLWKKEAGESGNSRH